MKSFMSVFFLSLVAFSAYGAQNGRPAMSNRIINAPSSRYTASINQLSGMANAINGTGTVAAVETENTVAAVTSQETVKKDMREAERNACINNNIGIGNTFVWASRFSDTSNYASMVEDVVNPENNVCFVRVELKSTDESRISVSDIKPKYFMWGEDIECGGWADKNMLEKRILDAKKGNRIAGIVASTVGAAGIGVGAMETFGNELIGHGLSGQKEMEDVTLYTSQLLTLKQKGQKTEYDRYVEYLKTIDAACKDNKDAVEKSSFDCAEAKAVLEYLKKTS